LLQTAQQQHLDDPGVLFQAKRLYLAYGFFSNR
jgi:hypothetical protein